MPAYAPVISAVQAESSLNKHGGRRIGSSTWPTAVPVEPGLAFLLPIIAMLFPDFFRSSRTGVRKESSRLAPPPPPPIVIARVAFRSVEAGDTLNIDRILGRTTAG